MSLQKEVIKLLEKRVEDFEKIHHSYEARELRSAINTIKRLIPLELFTIHGVVQAKPEKVYELIRQKFIDWAFGLETQAGEKLKVVDITDFNDIITEIKNELKDL